MIVMYAVNDVLADADTPIVVLAAGWSVPAGRLITIWPPPVPSAAVQCTVVPKPMMEMAADTVASLVETSDIDVGSTTTTGFGGGVYVEVDTDGTGAGCGAVVLCRTAGGETLRRGAGGLGAWVAAAGGDEAADGGSAECVDSRLTFGLAERVGLTAGLGLVLLAAGLDASTIAVGLINPETASRLGGEPPDKVKTSTAATAAAPATAATAAATRDTRRRLATASGLGNPS